MLKIASLFWYILLKHLLKEENEGFIMKICGDLRKNQLYIFF